MPRLLFPLLLCLATTACSVSSSSADTTDTTDTANNTDNPFAGQRPNIIIVLTDDQGYGDLACHGHPYLRTPNLDRLFTQSTRLTDFHASPTCAPTRAALMSGKYPFANGVTHTILERERMALSSYTIAQSLQDAGYTFFHCGRWGKADVPGGRWGRGNPDPESMRYEQFAVRSERWRYEAGDTLFDIGADPGQTTNVIDQHPEVAAQMRAAYDAWWESARPKMVNEDATLPPQRPYHVWFKQQQQTGGIPDWVPPVLD